jgi:hypothetical protein
MVIGNYEVQLLESLTACNLQRLLHWLPSFRL